MRTLTAWPSLLAGCAVAAAGAEAEVPTPPPFSYGAPGGWSQAYPHCGGSQQSPIDLRRAAVGFEGPSGGLLHLLDYPVERPRRTGELMLEDNTKTMEVPVAFGHAQLWRGPTGRFTGQQFHFHFPSEHTVEGKHLAGEMHLVHANSRGENFVLSLLFEEGVADNPFLESLDWHGSTLPQAQREIPLKGPLNITASFATQLQGGYFSYTGSLTTPPCTEGVHWIVVATPATVSSRQVQAFKTRFPDPMNNRPTQASSGRTVAFDKLPPLEKPLSLRESGSVFTYVLVSVFGAAVLMIARIELCGGA